METTQNISEKMNLLTQKLDQFQDNCTPQPTYQTKGSNINTYVTSGHNMEYKTLDNFIRKGIVTKGLNEANDGKMLLTPKVHEHIINIMSSLSPMRKLASLETISSNSLDVIIENDDLTIGWTNDIDSRSETEIPKLVRQTIHLHEMYAQPSTTQNLIDDSVVNVIKWLTDRITSAFAKTESKAFIYGDGVNQPKGILNYAPNEVEVLKCRNDNIKLEDIVRLINALEDKYLPNATFLLNRKIMHHIYTIQDGCGRFIFSRDNDNVETLMGIPIVCCDEMPINISGAQAVIALANFKQAYQIIQSKKPISIMQDPYTNKPYVKFYATKRIGGAIINQNAIKLLGGKFYGKTQDL